MKVACPSCPFRQHNYNEFNEVARQLSAKHGQPEPDFWQCLTIRERLKADGINRRQLACHVSVYDDQMNPDLGQAVPCVGLEQVLKGGQP